MGAVLAGLARHRACASAEVHSIGGADPQSCYRVGTCRPATFMVQAQSIMYRQLKSPLSVQLELTTGCNHRCIHCYNHFRKTASPTRSLTLKEEQIGAIISNLKAGGVPELVVTGGEPMLYPNLMLRTIELARDAGMKCSLNTNATLVTSAIAKELRKFKTGVLTSLLSFNRDVHDSLTSSEGSFDRLVDGIKVLQEYQVPVSVNMVVMQQNMDHVYETGRFVHALGIPVFAATKVHPAQGSTHFDDIKLPRERVAVVFDTLLRLKEEFGLRVESLMTCPLCLLKDMTRYGEFLLKRTCSAGKTGCTIGADGYLRSCGHADDSYGNAIEEPICDIWARMNAWRNGSLLPPECRQCKYIIRCGGGCRMDCKYSGKMDSMDPYATGNDFDLILPSASRTTDLIPLKQRFVLNESLVFRSEQFGTALIVDGEFKSIVTPDSASLLLALTGKSFSLELLLAEYRIDEHILTKFFTSLRDQGIILHKVID